MYFHTAVHMPLEGDHKYKFRSKPNRDIPVPHNIISC